MGFEQRCTGRFLSQPKWFCPALGEVWSELPLGQEFTEKILLWKLFASSFTDTDLPVKGEERH